MLKKLLVIALSVVALAAAGCGGGDKQAQTTIKVGATAGPHAEVVEAAAKEAAKSTGCGVLGLCYTGQSFGRWRAGFGKLSA